VAREAVSLPVSSAQTLALPQAHDPPLDISLVVLALSVPDLFSG